MANQLLRFVENPPTLRTPNNLLLGADFQMGLHVHLHVAAGADAMFYGDEGDAVLALEEPSVTVEQIFLDAGGGGGAFGCEFLLPEIQIFATSDKGGHVGLDFFLLGIMGLLGGLESGLEAFRLFHQHKLAIFDLNDDLLGILDLVLERGELVVLPCLKLLVLVTEDLILLPLNLKFEFLALDLDLALTRPGRFEAVIGGFEFPFPGCLFTGERRDLRQYGAKFLIAVLEGEEFFDLGEHDNETEGRLLG